MITTSTHYFIGKRGASVPVDITVNDDPTKREVTASCEDDQITEKQYCRQVEKLFPKIESWRLENSNGYYFSYSQRTR